MERRPNYDRIIAEGERRLDRIESQPTRIARLDAATGEISESAMRRRILAEIEFEIRRCGTAAPRALAESLVATLHDAGFAITKRTLP